MRSIVTAARDERLVASQGLAITEEFVILVVSAVAADRRLSDTACCVQEFATRPHSWARGSWRFHRMTTAASMLERFERFAAVEDSGAASIITAAPIVSTISAWVAPA